MSGSVCRSPPFGAGHLQTGTVLEQGKRPVSLPITHIAVELFELQCLSSTHCRDMKIDSAKNAGGCGHGEYRIDARQGRGWLQ